MANHTAHVLNGTRMEMEEAGFVSGVLCLDIRKSIEREEVGEEKEEEGKNKKKSQKRSKKL